MRTNILRWFEAYPVRAVVAIFALDMLLAFGLQWGFRTLAPEWPGQTVAFAALVILTALTLALVAWLKLWREAGYTAPSAWCALPLLIFPALVTIVPPLVQGVNQEAMANIAMLSLAYVLVGLHEETLYRGVMIHLLRHFSPMRITLLTAVLFGVSHMTNLIVRSNPALVLAQGVGAFCFGVAYAALRLRTNTIWFLIALHAIHDLLLQLTNLPRIPLDVAQVTILLFYGLYLVRKSQTPAPSFLQSVA